MNEQDQQPIDAEVTENQAVALRPDKPQPVGAALPPEQIKTPVVTAAQAKVEAIADLTKSAYARASELKLTQEEIHALGADFPDEAFKAGAAGKENLIYIEHAFLRDRLNQVFGPGQWAIIPRSRWAQEFDYYDKFNKTTKKASKVYVEAMLLIRGCFVSEAIGDMDYYPANMSTNYGDAVEGAKTAALRRCCKELGVGLQAWKKDWCDGWWKRNNQQAKAPAPVPTQSQPPAAKPPAPAPAASTPAASAKAKTVAQHLDDCKSKLIKQLCQTDQGKGMAYKWFVSNDYILDTEELEAVSVTKLFPSVDPMKPWEENRVAVKKDYEKLMMDIMGVKLMLGLVDTESTQDSDRQFDSEPEEPMPEDAKMITGTVTHVSEKSGQKKNGETWTCYGVKLDGFGWLNSFSKTQGEKAKTLKGAKAQVWYTEGERGNDLIKIEMA